MKLGLLVFLMCAATPAMASSYRVWTDNYKDVMVADCGDGTYAEMIDPNRCGEAMANGASGCTELAVFFSRTVPVSITTDEVVFNSQRSLKMNGDLATYTAFGGNAYDLILNPNYDVESLKYSCSMSIR